MSNEFLINIVPETLSRSSSGAITGRLSVTIGGTDFPEKEWVDFIVIVLGWWIDEVISILEEHSDESICEFMDGSFEFKIQSEGKKYLHISFVDMIDDETRYSDVTVSKEIVIRSLLLASNAVIKECRNKKWTDNDIVNFESKINRLNIITQGPIH